MTSSSFSWIPNALTLVRCLAVAPIAWFIYQQQFFAALCTFGFASFTDGLDGFLARRYQWQSAMGAFLDPMADKLLMLVSYVTLVTVGLIPVWLMLAVVLRDAVLVIGAALFRWLKGPYKVTPSQAGKLSTFTQILLVLWILVSQAFELEGEAITDVIIWLTLILTVYSGAEYVRVWWQKYRQYG